jgi:hypothetical protein
MSEDIKNKLLKNINNPNVIELINEIVILDINNYERVINGFTNII